jgi:hypothetical protein
MKSTTAGTPMNTRPAMANTGIARFWMVWACGPCGVNVVRGLPSLPLIAS